MWPTVQNNADALSWVTFFNYLKAQPDFTTNRRFDLSAQSITSQAEADAMITALNMLSAAEKGAMQQLIIRLASGAAAIDLGAIDFAPANKSYYR